MSVSVGFRRSKSDIREKNEMAYDAFVYINCGLCCGSIFYHDI